jgi:hypothetical protein
VRLSQLEEITTGDPRSAGRARLVGDVAVAGALTPNPVLSEDMPPIKRSLAVTISVLMLVCFRRS